MVIRKTGLRIVSTVLTAVDITKAWPEIPPVAAMAGDVPNSRARKADGSIIVRAPLRWISVAWWKPRSRSCRSDKWSRVVVSVVDGSAHGLRHKSGGLGNLDAQVSKLLTYDGLNKRDCCPVVLRRGLIGSGCHGFQLLANNPCDIGRRRK